MPPPGGDRRDHLSLHLKGGHALVPGASYVCLWVGLYRAPHSRASPARTGLVRISLDRVDWIGAAGNYAELHVGAETYLVRSTLQQLEMRLPSRRFPRIHRSPIVNLDRAKELHDSSHGDLAIVLANGVTLRLSRRYRQRLDGVLGL